MTEKNNKFIYIYKQRNKYTTFKKIFSVKYPQDHVLKL